MLPTPYLLRLRHPRRARTVLQTRHDEVYEGANLRDGKPPLRRDHMDRQGCVLVRTQQDPQPAVAYMLDDLIGALCGGRPRSSVASD
jgi:hypothetical protein